MAEKNLSEQQIVGNPESDLEQQEHHEQLPSPVETKGQPTPNTLIYNEKPNSEQLNFFSEIVAKNLNNIPKEIRLKIEAELLQNRIIEHGNKALVNFGSDLQKYLENNPVEKFMIKHALESAALALGLRLVDDKLISKSIKQAKENRDKLIEEQKKKQGIFNKLVNVFKKQESLINDTEIIDEIESLGAELEGLKIQIFEAEQALRTITEEKENFIGNKNAEATRIISDAENKRDGINEEIRYKKDKLTKLNRFIEKVKNDESKLAEIMEKLETQEQRKEEEKIAIGVEKIISLSSDSSPFLTKWRELSDAYLVYSLFLGKEAIVDYQEEFRKIYKIFSVFLEEVLKPLAKYGESYDPSSYKILQEKSLLRIKNGIPNKNFYISTIDKYTNNKMVTIFSKSVLLRSLSLLKNHTNLSHAQLLPMNLSYSTKRLCENSKNVITHMNEMIEKKDYSSAAKNLIISSYNNELNDYSNQIIRYKDEYEKFNK